MPFGQKKQIEGERMLPLLFFWFFDFCEFFKNSLSLFFVEPNGRVFIWFNCEPSYNKPKCNA